MNLFLSAFLLVFIFSFFSTPSFAANLLLNPGFEDGLSSWTLNGNTATVSAVSDQKHDGDSAVKLSKENSSSWAYFYQRVPIEAGKYYKLSGWLRLNDDFITNGKLRFYWLSDSNGTKISSDPVEVTLTSKNSDFQFIETESIVSPDQSTFAEAQGYVYLNQKNPALPLLFDDITFENNQPTPTPTLTPVPSPTPTSAPTPTKTPTPSPTPSPKPTNTPLISPTENQDISDTVFPTSVLGESTESVDNAVSEADSLAVEEKTSSNNTLPVIFIILGIVFILACGILGFWQFRKQKILEGNEEQNE